MGYSLLFGMEKSLAHWKAEHPLLFVSLSLCVGYLLAQNFGYSIKTEGTHWVCIVMALSMFLLLMMPFLKIKLWLQGIIILLILLSWGMVLYLTTTSQNLIHIRSSLPLISKLRMWLIQKIDSNIYNQEASGFAKALLIGVKTDIDKNIINAYTQLGIIHIIAISGMHLDIIFKNLVYVTQQLPRKIFWRWMELFIVLIAVWLYTFIAFASPSVVRASIFFSLFFVGSFFQQPKYTLNCIAGGILIILFFDIHAIQHIGLQLSYAAVLGIHLFYPLLYKMLPMDNPILDWMWNNLCITLSAQLTTLPILLYHFHQTSTLLIISNFIMVPLSSILLYALIILMLLPNALIVYIHYGKWIQAYITILNNAVLYLHQKTIGTPFLIDMSGFNLTVYYMALLGVYLWLYQRKAKFLFYTLVICSMGIIIKLFP